MKNLGITNKLWLLFYDWMVGSKCCVCVNGQISDNFTISRSIKQGGILSMMNLCIYMSDIHKYVDPDHTLGIQCHGIYMGSLAYADDIILMSYTKNGLDIMMDNVHKYARKWRFSFSLSKS